VRGLVVTAAVVKAREEEVLDWQTEIEVLDRPPAAVHLRFLPSNAAGHLEPPATTSTVGSTKRSCERCLTPGRGQGDAVTALRGMRQSRHPR
jgi:hypothetical protein